jgi:hypothetical protein
MRAFGRDESEGREENGEERRDGEVGAVERRNNQILRIKGNECTKGKRTMQTGQSGA